MNRSLVRKHHNLDLNAPGAIEELLAFHKALVGSARMEDDEDGADGTDEDGADGTEDGADGTDEDGADGTDDEDKPLGPKGTKALEAEKSKRRAAQAELRKFKDLGLTPEQIAALADKGGKDGDDKPDAEKLQREADRKATERANARILRSEVKAAAAGKLADPGDAYKFLDLDQFEVDDDGNVDEAEIADAIDDLIKKKPYLAAQSGKRFQGGGDGGARNERGKSQLTKADLDGMTPEEIVKARQDGRLTGLGINPKKP